MIQIRRLMSVKEDPIVIQKINKDNRLLLLINQALTLSSSDKFARYLQLECLWILINISYAGDDSSIKQILDP
jgi:hypothetical protein